jgi:hypothetical protein
MNSLKAVRYVGGFGIAGNVSIEDYENAKPDPICSFAEPVMKHMNDDHADSLADMVRYYVGIPCDEARIIAVDRLGMVV